MRRHLAWFSLAPLMVGGLLAGHSLGYQVATLDAHGHADALAHSGHGYFEYAPLALAVCLGLLLAALLARAAAGYRGDPIRPAASRAIILLPPLAFVVQEHLERLASPEGISWTVALEPTFLVGLALQLPFALAAVLLAWVLDSVAHAVGRALAVSAPLAVFSRFFPEPVRIAAAVPRLAGLARGYGERAPPYLRRP